MANNTSIDKIKLEIDSFLQNKATATSLDRGKSYYKTGKIIGGSINNSQVKIKVEGSAFYTVSFTYNPLNKEIFSNYQCNCPYTGVGICKHQVAAIFWFSDKLNDKNNTLSTRRNASDFLTIPNIKDSKLRVFSDAYFIQEDRLELELDDFKIKEQAENLYRVEAIFGTQYFRDDKTEKRILQLKIDGEDLAIACNCKKMVHQLCPHAYYLVRDIIKTKSFSHLQSISPSKIAEMGALTMAEYGLDQTLNWKEYFILDFEGYQRKMYPKTKYAHLISTKKLKEINLKALFTNNVESILEKKEQEIASKPYNLGFVFSFAADSNNINIEALVAKRGRKNLPMEIGFKRLSDLYNYDDVNLLPNANQLISVSNYFRLNYFKKEQDLNEILDELKEASQSLSEYPYLFYNADQGKHHFINKANYQAIKFIPNAPKIIYVLSQKGSFISINFIIEHQDTELPLDHSSIKQVHPLFLLIEDHLYFFSNKSDVQHLDVINQLNNKQFSASKFKEFFDDFLVAALRKYELRAENLENINVKTSQLKAISKELYLSELNNFIVFRLLLRHNDNILIDVLEAQSEWKLVGKTLKKQQIDKEVAAQFLEEIKALHPKFSQQNRDDILYLSYEDLLHDNFFLKAFKQLQANDIKVFGIDKLSKLKINPYPAKVSYKVSSGIDWFDIDTELSFGDETIDLTQLKKRFVPGSQYIELGNGSKGLIPQEWIKKLEKLFRHGEVKDGKLNISKKMFSLVDELFDEIDDSEAIAYIEDKKNKLLHFDKIQKHQIPSGINAQLRHYQEDGFQWLCFLDEFQWGGILADDMGLGKTLQIITFLKYILQKNKQSNLIIVPTSLLYNWQSEIEKFAPDLNIVFHYGSDRKKTSEYFNDYDIVFTTYGLMLSDIKLLKEHTFNYIILDESQAIKNVASKRYKAAKLLKAHNRIALTGTPIENNTFDLFAQMSFLNPGLLGTAASFKKEFATAIDKHRDADRAADLQKLIKPFVLRRTKEQVATELPDKIEDILYCQMGKSQQKVYDALKNEYRKKLADKMEEEGLNKARFSVLEGLTKLRQVCDSPDILPGEEKFTSDSAKIELLLEHIKEKTANHKILVFSQFVKMLKLIEKQLNSESISYEYLDGKSSTNERQQSVNHFQEDENCRVFLISIKAGGTGLNLTAADYVYLVDPWWNPAVENQAIDRCYRIGQDKKVIAYRMICKDTVEDKIIELQKKKKAIAGDIISTDENVLKQLDKTDILDLFS